MAKSRDERSFSSEQRERREWLALQRAGALRPYEITAALRAGERPRDLLAGGLQGSAVAERPTVELDARHLDSSRAECQRHLDHVRQVVEILPVHDRVDGERNANRLDPAGEGELALEAARIAADTIGDLGADPLQRKLNVVETCGLERAEACLIDTDARGDEIDVEACVPG